MFRSIDSFILSSQISTYITYTYHFYRAAKCVNIVLFLIYFVKGTRCIWTMRIFKHEHFVFNQIFRIFRGMRAINYVCMSIHRYEFNF